MNSQCFRSHFYVTYRGQDREQQTLRPAGFEKKECTGPKVTYIFGVELCGEVSLKGPFVAKAYVNKRDTHTGYHFEAGYRQSPVGWMITLLQEVTGYIAITEYIMTINLLNHLAGLWLCALCKSKENGHEVTEALCTC